MKKFDIWGLIKKTTEASKKKAHFHEGNIFYAKVGENIGFEQCGKGENFIRPILVIKKFNQDVFWGIPLSQTNKSGKYYHLLKIKDKKSVAILSQIKLFDSKRLVRKIGGISKEEIKDIKVKLIDFLKE